MELLKIGQVAEKMGISTVTLRHYEKINLVKPSFRSEAGYRMYTQKDVAKLTFILNGKAAGLSLNEIKQLLLIDEEKIKGSQAVKDALLNKITDIEQQVKQLQYILNYLRELTSLCDGKVDLDKCPILLRLKEETKS